MQVANTENGGGSVKGKKKKNNKPAVQDRNPERRSVSVQDRNPERTIQVSSPKFEQTLFTLNPSATSDRENNPFSIIDAAYEAKNGKRSPLSQISRDAKDARAAQNGQNLDDVIAAAQRGESVRPSDWSDYESGVQSWGQDVQDALDQAQKDSEARKGVWQDSTAMADYRRQQNANLTRLLQRSMQYQDFFNDHRDVYGDKTVDDIIAGLTEGRKALNSVTAYLDEDERIRGQFADQGEYDTYQRLSKASADELKQWNDELGEEISGLKRQLRERTRHGLTASGNTGAQYEKIQAAIDRDQQIRNRVLNRYYEVENREKLAELEKNPTAKALYETAGLDTTGRGGRAEAIRSLAAMGYDYDRLSRYQQTQQDAERYAMEQMQLRQEAQEHPWISSGVRVLTSPFQSLNYLDMAVRALTQGNPDDIEHYEPLNPYNMGAVNFVSGVQGSVAEKIAEDTDGMDILGRNVPSFLYQTGMSIADSAFQVGTLGPASLPIMGGAAAANQMQDIIARGGNNAQVLLGGTAAGAAEMLFEKFSVESLLTPKSVTGWKSLLKETAKQAGVEATEEVFTEIANILFDAAIMGADSSAELAVRGYMLQGMSEEEARKKVFFDQIGQVVEAGVGGALSGGIMGGAAGAFNWAMGGGQYSAAEPMQYQNDVGWESTRPSEPLPFGNGGLEQAARERVEAEVAQDRAVSDPHTQAEEETGSEILEQTAREMAEEEYRAEQAKWIPPQDTVIDGRPIRRGWSREGLDLHALARSVMGMEESPAVQESAAVQESPRHAADSGAALPPLTRGAEGQAQQRTAAMENASALVKASEAFGENGRKAFAAAWDGQDPGEFYSGFSTWYQAGLTGKPKSQVRGPYAGNIELMQRRDAYEAGQRDAAASLEREKAAVSSATVYNEEAGFDPGAEAAHMDKRTVAYIDGMTRATGVKAQMAQATGENGANGWYENGVMKIAADAEDPGMVVASHEITHRMQELAPAEYREYRNYAMNRMDDKMGSVELVEAYKERYAQVGQQLTTEQAMDEIAADFTKDMLNNVRGFQDLAGSHRSVAQKLLDSVRDFISKVKNFFKGDRSAQDAAAGSEYGMSMAELEQAAKLWGEAFQAAKETVRESQGQNNSAGQDAGGKVRYSLKSFEDGRRFVDVDTDQEQFDGLTTEQMQQKAKHIILDRFRGKVIGGEYTAFVDKRSAEHYAYPANRRMDTTQKQAKMRASPELDNILAASTFRENIPDDGRHPNATGGMDKLDTIFRFNGRVYQAEITALVTDRGRVFYDMTKFNDITGREVGQTQSAAETSNDAVDDSVPQPGGEVNPSGESGTRYSLKGTRDVQKELYAVKRENEQLRERLDYWRGQTRRTTAVTTDKKSVTAAAKSLLKEYGADLDAGELAGRLQALYDSMATGRDGNNELGPTDAWKGAEAIARDIAGAAVEEWSLDQEFPGLRQRLKTTPITIGHEYDGDIRNENFRREYRGKLKLSADGPTNVDAVYAELSEAYPGLFPADITHPADQMEQIMDVADSLATVQQQGRFDGQMEAAVAGITNEIVEGFFDLPQTRATFADRQAAKLDAAKAHGKQRVQETREQYQARMQELRDANRQAVQRVLDRERGAREKQVNALKDQYKARTEAGRERQRAGELRRKITRHTRALSDKLLRPTDKAHIPEELRGPVAKVLESINLEGQYTIDPETGKRTKGGDGSPTKRTQAFLELKQKYAEINKNGGDIVIDPALLGSDADGIQGSIDAVIAMGDTRLADMNSQQLGTVWQVVKAVEHSVQTAGKLLSKGKYERTSQWADALEQDTRTRRNREIKAKTKIGVKGKAAVQHSALDLENPYTFFSHFGQAGKDMYRTLRDAQDRQQLLTNQVVEAREKVVDKKTPHKLEKTTHEYTTEGGQKLTLSTAQAMELYELSKRKQAREHLLIGGIVQPEVPGTKVRRGTDAIRLTMNDLAEITGSLSAEEKGIADGLQKITTTLLSDMGNEASMAAYGYKKFTEPDYWPIRSAREGLHSNIEKGGDNARSIKNTGMAQATVPHANNQVDIGSIFDTFARHAGDMVDYAAWLCPMEDLNRLYNYQYRDGDGNPTGRTVKGTLDAKGGEGAQKYWQDLMEDIQNGIRGKNDSAIGAIAAKGIGAFKGAAVGGNIRVIIQQPTAFVRANAVLNPADLSRGLARGATKGRGWKKALQYSPIAMRKDAGGFDISAPGTMKETLFGRPGAVNKVNDFMSKGAGWADALTWGKLWNACEWQVARQHKELRKGSDAFYQEVNRVFTDMIDQTQVVDGILQRSNIMRSSNAMVQQATSFMGEPIMSLNMTMRAWDQLRNEQDPKRRGQAIRNLGRTATALVATAAVNAAAQSLVDAMRDDDKDKKYWERFWSAFNGQTGEEETDWERAMNFVLEGNLGGSLNPAEQIPYVKDFLSLIKGYDVSRTEMSVIQGVIEAGQNFIKSVDGTGPKTQAYALNKLFTSAAKVFGIPAANLERDVWAGLRSIAIETGNLPAQYEMEKAVYNVGSEKNKSRFTDIMYRALESGDLDTYRHIQNELMNEMGLDGKTLDSAMKSRYKSRQEEDPGYSLPGESYDLLGIRPESKGGEKEEPFGADDLDSTAYQKYSTQRAREYRESENALAGSPIFGDMDEDTRNKVLQAAYDLANSGALEDASGGQYKPNDTWILDAGEAEKKGIEPWEFALWRVAKSDAADTKGADGKAVKGETKKDHVMDWLSISGLSEEQQEFLWGTAYTSDFDEYRDNLAEYRSYGQQMDEAYGEISGGLADNPIFDGMDAELREKVTDAAMEAAEQMAKSEVLDGYEYENQWIAKTGEAEAQGIPASEYIMWHVVCGNTYSDRDANGNEILGQRKQDHLRTWLRSNTALSDQQRYWLWRQQYKSLPF